MGGKGFTEYRALRTPPGAKADFFGDVLHAPAQKLGECGAAPVVGIDGAGEHLGEWGMLWGISGIGAAGDGQLQGPMKARPGRIDPPGVGCQ